MNMSNTLVDSLFKPFDSDLEDIQSYRRYLEKCNTAKSIGTRLIAKLLLEKTDEELHKYLEESRMYGKYCRFPQEDCLFMKPEEMRE